MAGAPQQLNQTTTDSPPMDRLQCLTPIQAMADDLYLRGWNVFPLPSVDEWRRYAAIHHAEATSKPPYILRPLFLSRMLRGETARNQQQFLFLFEDSNLGVMCGATSGNLVCIDADTPQDYRAMRTLLDRLGVPYLSQTTSRGRGAFFVRIQEGEVRNMAKSTLPGFSQTEVWGRAHYVVIAPSTHPLGTSYQWDTPGSPAEVLPPGGNLPAVSIQLFEGLNMKLAVRKERGWEGQYADLPEWAHCLSPNNQAILLHGAYEQGQRNNRLVPLVYDIAANVLREQVSYDDGLEALVEVGERCKPPMDRSELRTKLDSALQAEPIPAREFLQQGVPTRRKPGSTPAWEIAARWCQGYAGWRSQKERAVMEAVIERARLTWIANRSGLFRATRREIAELAQCSQITAQKYLAWLSWSEAIHPPAELPNRPLLRVTRDNRSHGYLYRINEQFAGFREARAQLTHDSPLDVDSVLMARAAGRQKASDAELDAFAGDSSAYRVWKHLLDHPEPTIKAAATACKINYGTVRNVVRRLKSHHLVTQEAGTLVGVPQDEPALQAIAAARQTNGRTAARRRQHRRERAWMVNQLIDDAKYEWRARYGANPLRYASRRWKHGWEQVAAQGEIPWDE